MLGRSHNLPTLKKFLSFQSLMHLFILNMRINSHTLYFIRPADSFRLLEHKFPYPLISLPTFYYCSVNSQVILSGSKPFNIWKTLIKFIPSNSKANGSNDVSLTLDNIAAFLLDILLYDSCIWVSKWPRLPLRDTFIFEVLLCLVEEENDLINIL